MYPSLRRERAAAPPSSAGLWALGRSLVAIVLAPLWSIPLCRDLPFGIYLWLAIHGGFWRSTCADYGSGRWLVRAGLTLSPEVSHMAGAPNNPTTQPNPSTVNIGHPIKFAGIRSTPTKYGPPPLPANEEGIV